MKKIFLLVPFLILLFMTGCAKAEPAVLRVAIPYSDYIQDPKSNYYINWLEKETGIKLDIVTIRQTRSTEYLDALFSSNVDIDVVMFGGDFNISEEELKEFSDRGLIAPNGDTYYYGNYGTRALSGVGQIVWINSEWLEALGLSVPETAEEFAEVLYRFKTEDPNGNGIEDEIPIIGALEADSFSPVFFFKNAGERPEYIEKLKEKGVIDEDSFAYSLTEVRELVNSPANLVGVFATDSISDVIYQGNPEIMARYMHVAPLKGKLRTVLKADGRPQIGAIINARSNQLERARKLLETMLTMEASLIARFGEEGVDWDYSDGRDVSIYGSVSTIATHNYIWNTSQNKHLNGIGPIHVPEEYLEGVTWNGVNSDTEYIDARARMTYREFVTDDTDNGSDKEWEDYLRSFQERR